MIGADLMAPKVILFGERSLRHALSEYTEHFHAERNHQGKGNVLLFPRDTNIRRAGPVQCPRETGWALAVLPSRGGIKWVDVPEMNFLTLRGTRAAASDAGGRFAQRKPLRRA